MQEHVTLLGPAGSARERKSLSSTLPPDLMEQVRGRIRLLALLLLVALSFDPLVYFGIWLIATAAPALTRDHTDPASAGVRELTVLGTTYSESR